MSELAEQLAHDSLDVLRRFSGCDPKTVSIDDVRTVIVGFLVPHFLDAPLSRIERAVEAFVTNGDRGPVIDFEEIVKSIRNPQLDLP